jgi:hypothetical protein
LVRARIFDHEQARYQPMTSRGYQHGIGSGCGLHTRGYIRSFTENIRFLAGTRTNHHCAGIDADPYGNSQLR